MLAKPSFKYFIIIFSLIVGVWSLYCDLFWTTHNHQILNLKQLFSPYNLEFSIATRSIGHVDGLNKVNAIFDGLLLMGCVSFAIAGNAQIRLLRFVYAIIFGSNVVAILRLALNYLLFRPMAGHKAPVITNDLIITNIEFLAMACAWLIVSTIIIRYFNGTREVAVDLYEQEDGEQVGLYIEASKGTRFMHYLVEGIIVHLIFIGLNNNFDNVLTNGDVQKMTAMQSIPSLFFFFCCTWFYHFIYEWLFGITPVKALTGTRVVDDEGKTPSFKTIVLRSFIRLVPFEPFSFFGTNGWHDKWSDTYVVMEEMVETDEQISTSKL